MRTLRILALLLAMLVGTANSTTVHAPNVTHKLYLTLEIGSNTLIGVDTIRIGREATHFLLAKKCEKSIRVIEGGLTQPNWVSGVQLKKDATSDESEWLKSAEGFAVTGPGTVVVHWRGVFNDTVSGTLFSREQVAGVPDGVIGKQGVFLSTSALYYPFTPDDVQSFSIQVTTPNGWIPVTTGLRKKVGTRPEGAIAWDFGGPWQLDNVSVAAGEFEIHGRDTLGVRVETCFTSARDSLSETYLNASLKYVARYSTEFGTFPWPAFAVVEAFFPAGYGMPGFTFLGSDVIALPFIVSTSLGHEVLHNWWGNGVYVSSGGENWCEGLTTYGADWAYKAERGPEGAIEYRRGLIKDFASYVTATPENDFPLRKFTSRSSGATRAVGYGKSAFLFHSIETKIGHDAFSKGLQRFYGQYRYGFAGWKELRECFEFTSKQSLETMFSAWLDQKGAPKVVINESRPMGDSIRIIVGVEGAPQVDAIPVTLLVDGVYGEEHWYPVKKGLSIFKVSSAGSSINVLIDPAFKLWRRPAPGEIPPALSDVYGAKKVSAVMVTNENREMDSALRKFAEQMFDSGLVWEPSKDPRMPVVRFVSTLDGYTGRVKVSGDTTQFGADAATGVKFFVVTEYIKGVLTTTFYAPTIKDVEFMQRKAPHYGKYSYIGFDASGKNIVKGNWKTGAHSLHFTVKP